MLKQNSADGITCQPPGVRVLFLVIGETWIPLERNWDFTMESSLVVS
jgi:hypothetical protein